MGWKREQFKRRMARFHYPEPRPGTRNEGGCRDYCARVGALRRADGVGPTAMSARHLCHEIASRVRAFRGAADGVGEAEFHDRAVGVGAFAGPRAERAALPCQPNEPT